MFPGSGNTTTSLKNNLLCFQCSSQNRPRSFYLIPGCEEKTIGKENPVDASKGAFGGCHQLPCEPPFLTVGHTLNKGNKGACLDVMGKAWSCDPKEDAGNGIPSALQRRSQAPGCGVVSHALSLFYRGERM